MTDLPSDPNAASPPDSPLAACEHCGAREGEIENGKEVVVKPREDGAELCKECDDVLSR